MSHLSGKLETFSLRQILVLLADADATGELQVASPTLRGRVFFQSGVVAYATTRTGEESLRELDRLIEADGDDTAGSVRPAIEEQLTEVLHGLTLLDSGTFDLEDGAAGSPSFDVGVTFSVSDLLNLVDERIEEWRKIREVIPTTASPLELAPDLPDGRSEMTVDAEGWSMLSAVGGGASVAEVAARRDIYEFKAAGKLAELVETGLLILSAGSAPILGPTDAIRPVAREPQSIFSRLEMADDPLEELENEPPAATGLPDLGEEEAALPKVEPKIDPVSFSKKDLTPEERDELIRNIGKGIYPSD